MIEKLLCKMFVNLTQFLFDEFCQMTYTVLRNQLAWFQLQDIRRVHNTFFKGLFLAFLT